MKYPLKATFYSVAKSENDYGEIVRTASENFSTGGWVSTVSFKDKLQGNIKLDAEQLYLYVRKSPKTKGVSVGDEVKLGAVSDKTYSVIAIDPKFIDRSEIMFLIDAMEE